MTLIKDEENSFVFSERVTSFFFFTRQTINGTTSKSNSH